MHCALRPTLLLLAIAVGAAACADPTGPASETGPAATMTALTTQTNVAPGTLVRFRAAGFVIPTDSLAATVGTQATWLYRDAATPDELVFVVPALSAGANVLRFPSLKGSPQWAFTLSSYAPVIDAAGEMTTLVNQLSADMDSLLAEDGSDISLSLRDRLNDIETRLAGLSAAQKAQVAYLVRSNRTSDAGTVGGALQAAIASVIYADCSTGQAELSLRKNRLILLTLQVGIGVGLVALPTGITQIAGGILLVEAIASNRTLIKEMPGIIAGAYEACWTRRTIWEIVGADAPSAHAVHQDLRSALRVTGPRASNAEPTVFLNDLPRSFALQAQYGLDDSAVSSLASLDTLILRLREILPTAWVDAMAAAADVGTSRTRQETTAGVELRDISNPAVVGTLDATGEAISLRFRFADGAPQTPIDFTYRLVDPSRGLNIQRTARLESADAVFDANLWNFVEWVGRDVTPETTRLTFYVMAARMEAGVRYRVRWGYRPTTNAEWAAAVEGVPESQYWQALYDLASASGGSTRELDSNDVQPTLADGYGFAGVLLSDETRDFRVLGSDGTMVGYLMHVEVQVLDAAGLARRVFRGVAGGGPPAGYAGPNAWGFGGFNSTQ